MRASTSFERSHLHEVLKQTQLATVKRADFATLAGLLELERGNSVNALASGEAALALYAERKGMSPIVPGEPLAEKYVAEIRQQRR
jgi:hypothetical protein